MCGIVCIAGGDADGRQLWSLLVLTHWLDGEALA